MISIQDPIYSQVGGLRQIGDESVTLDAGARRVVTSVALTAARTLSLPKASLFGAGIVLAINDAKRGATNTNTITGSRFSGDTYNGAASNPVINAAGGKIAIVSDGVSNWQDA